jgi:hypothetical protein
VNQVVAADCDQVAVAGDDRDFEFRVGELEPGGEGQRATVGRVERVELDVAGGAAGAPDAGYDRVALARDPALADGRDVGVEHRAETAGGAPDVRDSVHPQEVFVRVSVGVVAARGGAGRGAHFAPFIIAA